MKEIDFTEQIVKWREEQEAAMTKKQYEKIDTKELKRDDKKEKKEHIPASGLYGRATKQ